MPEASDRLACMRAAETELSHRIATLLQHCSIASSALVRPRPRVNMSNCRSTSQVAHG